MQRITIWARKGSDEYTEDSRTASQIVTTVEAGHLAVQLRMEHQRTSDGVQTFTTHLAYAPGEWANFEHEEHFDD